MVNSNNSKFEIAQTDKEILDCFTILHQLRPHLEKDQFLDTVKSMQQDGFKLAYIKDNQNIVAVAGFRIYSNLFMGKHLYVDDLVTHETSHSKGYGTILINNLRAIAENEECNYFHLDSGTQRHQAHKFYLNQGLDIASFHFSQKLK